MKLELRIFREGTWDGEVASLHPTGLRAERKARDGSGLIEVYRLTDRTEDVVLLERVRSGDRERIRPARVFTFVGHRHVSPRFRSKRS